MAVRSPRVREKRNLEVPHLHGGLAASVLSSDFVPQGIAACLQGVDIGEVPPLIDDLEEHVAQDVMTHA